MEFVPGEFYHVTIPIAEILQPLLGLDAHRFVGEYIKKENKLHYFKKRNGLIVTVGVDEPGWTAVKTSNVKGGKRSSRRRRTTRRRR